MNTDVLSTRQVATLLGVGEATVKRWADAGEIDCFRTPGGHRKFRLRDVTAFVHERQYQARGPLPAATPQGTDGLGEEAIKQFQDAALRGDAAGLVGQLAGLRLRGHDLPELFDEVATPALQRVGEKWADASLSVAEEHVASQAVIDAVARSQPLAEPPGEPVRPDRGVAVVAAVAGELHDIAARMAACLLRAQGFEVLAPLAQTPARELADLILRSRASLIVLSSTIASEVGEQVAMAVAAARQTGGRVLVGGEGMRKARLPEEAKLLRSLRDLEAEARGAGRKRARS
ncbi:MAG TPA: helix-turn-helix domain-containing protein [Myxococcales bacterium]|nr:helix-turn-helix domain-containing protein [Myxococcales bacterium]